MTMTVISFWERLLQKGYHSKCAKPFKVVHSCPEGFSFT